MGQTKSKRKVKHDTPISSLLEEEHERPAAPAKRHNPKPEKKRVRQRKNRTIRRGQRSGGRR